MPGGSYYALIFNLSCLQEIKMDKLVNHNFMISQHLVGTISWVLSFVPDIMLTGLRLVWIGVFFSYLCNKKPATQFHMYMKPWNHLIFQLENENFQFRVLIGNLFSNSYCCQVEVGKLLNCAWSLGMILISYGMFCWRRKTCWWLNGRCFMPKT